VNCDEKMNNIIRHISNNIIMQNQNLNHCMVAKYFHEKITAMAKKYKLKLIDLEQEFKINTIVDCACDFCEIKEEEEDPWPYEEVNKDKIMSYESDYDSDDYEEIECRKVEIKGKIYLLDICTDAVYNYDYPNEEVVGLDLSSVAR